MQIYNQYEVLGLLAKAIAKPCVYISFSSDDPGYTIADLMLAAPYLNPEDHGQIMCDGVGYIVCETEEEQQRIFWQTRGDSHCEANAYDGPVKVFALTFNARGEGENENT
jgi:hypothetical protein